MCTENPLQCGGSGGCSGATAELAYDTLANGNGIVQEYQYAYEGYYGQSTTCQTHTKKAAKVSIDGYVQLPSNNYTAIMNAVGTVGPVVVGVDASSWSAYEEGIYVGLSSSPDMNHEVVLAGYGHDNSLNMDYYLVRNSWAPSWY